MEKSGKKKKIIIFIVLILIIAGALAIYINYENNKIPKSNVSFTGEEFAAIVKAYGEAAEYAIDTYKNNNGGKLPEFQDIRYTIHFETHFVMCDTHKINYDGSIYLAKCNVDGIYNDDVTYGEDKLEPQNKSGKIYIYKTKYDYYFAEQEYDYLQLIDTYECVNLQCKGYDYNIHTNEAIIYDGKYYLYNTNNKTKKDVALGTIEYSSIKFAIDDDKTYGLILGVESYYEFYDFETNNILNISGQYMSVYAVKSLLSKNYLFATTKDDNGAAKDTNILNFKTGNIINTIPGAYMFTDTKIGYSAYAGGDTYYDIVKLYDKEFNLIIETKSREYGMNSNNTITLLKDKHFEIINLNNEVLYTSKDYNEIVTIVEDHIAVLDDNKNLKIIDLKENEKATLVKITDNLNVHSYISGWYSENGKNGIYIVVENKDIPYGTEGSGLEYYYIPSTGETGVIKTEGVGGYAKPILYLYPEKKTNIKVSFEKPYLLTTTYPKYKNVWEVTAKPNGDLYDKNGKYYYGLYWEEEGSIDVDFHTGFYVTKDNAIDFLEEKLSYLGLNNRERNEFIMYWLPILEKNEQNLVYFETTTERESYNKLIINPKPDSILRLAIHVKKVNEPITIQEQKLQKFRRKGFTVVEWGGVIH